MLITQIESSHIKELVMQSIASATNEILATMDMAQEINQPLPDTYYDLLSQKLEQGVVIKRVGFGTESEFEKIRNDHPSGSPNLLFKHIHRLKNYQRMITIDGRLLYFGVGDQFFKTEYLPIINAFKEYFISLEAQA